MLVRVNDYITKISHESKQKIWNVVTNKFTPTIGRPIITKIYKRENSGYTFPRQLYEFVNIDLLIPKKINNKYRKTKYKSDIRLINKDQEIISTLIHDKLLEKNRVLLNLRAGSGKTFIAADIMSKLKLPTLFIVSKKTLAVQAKKDLAGLNAVTEFVDTAWLKKKDIGVVDVVIMIINTAVKQPNDFFDNFGFVIFDEVHEYVSTSRREIFWKLDNCNYVLGMSATTDDRNDGLDILYKLHLGKVIYGNDYISEQSITNGYSMNIRAIKYRGTPEYSKYLIHEKTKKIFMPDIIKQLMEDPSRWKLLKHIIMTEYSTSPDRNIYVFSAIIDPLIKLKEELGIDDCGLFVGGISDNEITRIQKECRIILTTYKYASTGVSIIKMNTIIFATPQMAQMGQIVPRILRTGGDTDVERRVIDIVDINLNFLIKQFNKRCECYDKFDSTYKYYQAYYYSMKKAEINARKIIDSYDSYTLTEYDDDFDIIEVLDE